MIELVSSFIFAPLSEAFEIIFSGLFRLTHNYGISLLLLSLVTTLLLTPVESRLSVYQKFEKKLQSILAPQIKAIKAQYSGEAQHSALKRLYTRYGYNPIYSFRSALGVLVQLPFLIGAYLMLSSYGALNGVKWLCFADLSRPDGLVFGVINLLPIVMTAVNIATAFVLPNCGKKERVQAIVIALLFLVLLYQAPSALLIYWTTNNILGLLKAAVKRFNLISALQKLIACRTRKLTIPVDIKVAVGFVALGVLFTVASRLHAPFFVRWSEIFRFFSDASLSFVLIYLGYQLFAELKTRKETTTLKRTAGYFLLILTAFTLIRVIGVWLAGNTGYKLTSQLIGQILLLLAYKQISLAAITERFSGSASGVKPWFLPGALTICAMVFLYFPITLYITDPASFQNSVTDTIRNQVIAFEICLLFIGFVLLAYKYKFFSVLSGFVAILAICALSFAFLVAPDYGVLSGFKFQHEELIYNGKYRRTDLLVILLTTVFVVAIILLKKFRAITVCLWISALSLVTCAFFQGFSYTAKHPTQNLKNAVNTEAPKEIKHMWSFSKNGQNVLVIMLDMFTGIDMESLLKADPSLFKKLAGFTWYRDTLAAGCSTIYGKAPILGGPEAECPNLNKDRNTPLEKKVNIAWDNLFLALIQHDYQIQISDNQYYQWLRPEYLSESVRNRLFSFSKYGYLINKWDESNNFSRAELNDSSASSNFLSTFGLFSVIPLTTKKSVYTRGTWREQVIKNDGKRLSHRNWAELAAIPNFISTTEDSGSNFKFLSNAVTHFPWNLDSNCWPCNNPTFKQAYFKAVPDWNGRLQAELCALYGIIDIANKLKALNIFENTQIIVTSDHGNWDVKNQFMIDRGVGEHAIRSSLLLVKRIGSTANDKPLEVDNSSLYAVSDIPDIILNNYRTDAKKNSPWNNSHRVRQTSCALPWQRSRHPENFFQLKWIHQITGSMFNKENWKEVPQ